MALTSSLRVVLGAVQSAPLDLGSVRFPVNYDRRIGLADGTAAGQADLMFTDTRTLAASGSEDLDLSGSLVDALGNTLAFARVKGIVIAAAAGNTNNVVIGGAASNGFVNWVGDATDTVNVRPGGILALFAPDATGYAVTAATGDLLHVANSGGTTSVSYDVVIIGASA